MLKNIIFILNKEQKIPDSVQNGSYAVAYDSAFAGPDDSIVITDDIKTAHSSIEQGCPVVYIYDGENYISGISYIAENVEACTPQYCNEAFCRQKGIPMTVLQTERTYIKEITVDDLGEVYELYDDDEIRKYMEPLYEYEEEKKFTESYIKNMYGMYGFGMWLVKDRDTDKLIGRAGLELRLIDGVEEMELGYIIGKKYRHKGYGYEVCTAIKKYAKDILGAAKLNIIVSPDNIPSIKLAEKLGAHDTGRSANSEYIIMECELD